LLRPESVDPDLLEEQARSRLGLSGADEVVILKDKR
jgi:cell division protein FtsB